MWYQILFISYIGFKLLHLSLSPILSLKFQRRLNSIWSEAKVYKENLVHTDSWFSKWLIVSCKNSIQSYHLISCTSFSISSNWSQHIYVECIYFKLLYVSVAARDRRGGCCNSEEVLWKISKQRKVGLQKVCMTSLTKLLIKWGHPLYQSWKSNFWLPIQSIPSTFWSKLRLTMNAMMISQRCNKRNYGCLQYLPWILLWRWSGFRDGTSVQVSKKPWNFQSAVSTTICFQTKDTKQHGRLRYY